MRKVSYFIDGHLTRCHDAAVIVGDENPLKQLVESAIQTISTDVEINCGGYRMHLAAWQDPDDWGDDWREKGVEPEDVPDIVAAAVETEEPVAG